MQRILILLVTALAGCTPQRVAVLELHVVTTPEEGDCPGAPLPALLRISPDAVLYGIEHSVPREIAIKELESMLQEAKRERPDREVLYMEIDDGVSFEKLVAAADQAQAAGFHQRSVVLLPQRPVLRRTTWVRPQLN